MLRRAWLLVSGALLFGACGLEEHGAGPASGGGAGSGGGASGGAGPGGSGGGPLGGAGGSGGAGGGASGSAGASGGAGAAGSGGSDAGSDAASDAPADAGQDAASDAGLTTLLDGARIELPCLAATSSTACTAAQTMKSFAFEGQAGVSYDVTLRFRGVVEYNAYSCTSATPPFCTGGSPLVAGWNVFSVKIADPAQTYHLNAGSAGILHCHALDYQATIPIKGGAQIELEGDAIDGQQVQNTDAVGKPIVVAGVSPDPQAFNGQFVQIDVVSIQKK